MKATALAGDDGRELASLLVVANRSGAKVLHDVAESVIRRSLQQRSGIEFNNDEILEVADAIGGIRANADLLGRLRIHELATEAAGTPFKKFAADPTLNLISAPRRALDYFTALIPTLNLDPERWGEALRRRAFFAANSFSQVLTERLKGSIAGAIEQPKSLSDATYDVQSLLDQGGVTPRNPQYAEMVVRTNVQDAYQVAAFEQMCEGDNAQLFPVWQYLGILDGREGDDHRPHFNLYYPSSVSFAEVRGDRIFNCRCSFAPILLKRWLDLQSRGAVLQASW